MLKLMFIGSGSSGNCTYVEIGGKKILIDMGLNAKRISTALSSAGTELCQLDAVLITHTHSDHVSAMPVAKKKLHCPMYMSALSRDNLEAENARILVPGVVEEIADGVYVRSFETSHDCPGSMGFRIDCGNDSLGYATDLGHVSENILQVLKGAGTVVIESNHDVQMLKSGPYPYILKKRILSGSGHLSNDNCGHAMRVLAESGTKKFFLAHLSRENNTPDLARNCAAKALAGTESEFYILPQYGGSECICI